MSRAAPTVGLMRLLHTSDWHLGRSFHREDLLGAQEAFVDWLVGVVVAERVDAVVVSGDVYDRALPSVDAVALCDDALARLAGTGAEVVLISGNHDSARRLGFGAAVMRRGGVHLRTDPRAVDEPVLVGDEHGPVGVFALPYLEPDAVRADLGCEGRSQAAVVTAAMDRVRARLAGEPMRSVVLAHAFVAGGEASESERDVSVGGSGLVPASAFAGVTYAALGHLHGPQEMAPGVHYSGSPLAMSFSEEHHRKSVALVELGASAPARVELLPCPVPRRLARIRGRLDDLLSAPQWTAYEDHYLHVTLTDPQRPREPMDRLRARFPHVLLLGFEPEGGEVAGGSYAARVTGRSDLEVALDFVAHVRGDADEAERVVLAEALEAVRVAEAAG